MDKNTILKKARADRDERELLAEIKALRLAGLVSLFALALAAICFAAVGTGSQYSGKTVAALLVGVGTLSCAVSEGYLLFALKSRRKIFSFVIFAGFFIYAAVKFAVSLAK